MLTPRTYMPFVLFLLAVACACANKPQSTADIPRLISPGLAVAVAPFTQPVHPGQLLMGQIPEKQGRIPRDALLELDRALRQALLTGSKRQYDFIARTKLPDDLTKVHSAGQPGALPRWLAYGQSHGARLLLVPQVLDWHEREGSEAGVTSSAHVRCEFFLLNIPEHGLVSRSIFEEKQVGLADNLLGVGDFFKRRGAWVSAGELATEGMRKAVGDLGL